MEKRSRNWDALVTAVSELHGVLQEKPDDKKLPFQRSPGGILNAYREGDLSFDDAVMHLEDWAGK